MSINSKTIKEILVIKGAGNRGKTIIINLLYDALITHCSKQNIPIQDGNGQTVGKQSLRKSTDDFQEVLVIQGIKVGFASKADGEKETKQNCKFFENENCNICVTACRTRGKTVTEIKDFANKKGCKISFSDNIRWLEKNLHAAEYKSQTTKILNPLKNLLNI